MLLNTNVLSKLLTGSGSIHTNILEIPLGWLSLPSPIDAISP